MMDCRVWLGVKRLSGMRPMVNSVMATKGWVCGVAEKGSDWLGSYTGPHTKEVWTGISCPVGNKDKISHG